MNISAANRDWKAEAEKRREKLEQSRNLPSRWQGGRLNTYRLKVIGGNVLTADPFIGILFSETEITELPTAYDPDVDTSFIDGIGRGWLYKNGVLQPKRVLILNDPRGGSGAAFILDDGYLSGVPIRIPVAGGGSEAVYIGGL